MVRVILLSFCLVMALTACQRKPDNYDNQGNPVYFSQYQGKWILINYWASWCHPCWQEVPELNAFASHYAKQVKIFGVNFDHADSTTLNALMQKMHIQYSNLIDDPATRFGIDNIPALPTTIIINPQGKVATILTGEQTQESLRETIGLS
jgi:thiol-disulfide isomerase/thioredoxin